MDNINFNINSITQIKSKERGQANKILAYVNGDININGQKLFGLNNLRLQDSKFYGKKIIDIPQVPSGDGTYRSLYNITPDLKKTITKAVIKAYEAKNGTE